MAHGRLEGLNAVISGGAAGAGGAASEIFAREGARVAIIDIQEDVGLAKADTISQNNGRAFFVKADVSSADEVEAAIAVVNQRFENRIDVLFNHAGTVIIKPFLETTETDWDWMMNVNVKSMFLMTRAVLPSMLGREGGAIVNTSSISAVAGTPDGGTLLHQQRAPVICSPGRSLRNSAIREFAAMPCAPASSETAHGIRELKELRDYGVEVTEEDICRLQGRVCEPEEVANVALFLASSDASFVNGETLFCRQWDAWYGPEADR